jgi:hypothetical protein
VCEPATPRKSTVPRWSWGERRRELGRGPLARTTSRCVPASFLARLRWLAQFSETLAIAPSALGSAHRLAAKRRTAKAGMNTSGSGGLYPSEACGLIVL